MVHATHRQQLPRLKRVQGQVAGVIRMVEEERYCIDILTQLRAARAALRKVEQAILREHADHCITGSVRAGSRAEAEARLEELFEALGRFTD